MSSVTIFATGIALGLLVSVPPGPNSALCINLATDGAKRAIPLITGIALTDAAYSVLAASGILIASQTSAEILSYLTPAFMLGTAVIAWSPALVSAKASFGVAFLNPATAAIWLSLSSIPAMRLLTLPDLLLRSLPVALGTAAWFTLLAVAAARIGARLTPQHTTAMQRFLGLTLAAMGLTSLVTTLA